MSPTDAVAVLVETVEAHPGTEATVWFPGF
jgi:hypothetical protein